MLRPGRTPPRAECRSEPGTGIAQGLEVSHVAVLSTGLPVRAAANTE